MRYGNTATAFSEKSALIVFNAFVHLALASKMQFGGAKKHKRIARKAISGFRKFISKDSKGINLSHKLMLLDAGYLALDATNDERTVQQAFDRAITLAKRAGFRQDAALGNQLCGEYFLYRQLDQSWAPHYLSRSIELFRDWGAIGVADSIQRKFEEEIDLVTITNLESTNHHGKARHPGKSFTMLHRQSSLHSFLPELQESVSSSGLDERGMLEDHSGFSRTSSSFSGRRQSGPTFSVM